MKQLCHNDVSCANFLLCVLSLCVSLSPLSYQSDIIGGFQHDNLLSAVLEALSSPSLSYIGLGYDTTLNLQISE